MTWTGGRTYWRLALRELIEGDPDEGYVTLLGELAPAGRTPAAAEALPVLLAHVEDRAAAARPEVLGILSQVAHAGGDADERWSAAWADAVPRLAALLDDPARGVRQGAALALGAAPDPAVVRLLLDRWAAERVEPARLGLVIALGEAGGEDVRPWLAEREESAAITVAALTSLGGPPGPLADAMCGDMTAFGGVDGHDRPGHVVDWVAGRVSPRLRAEVLAGLVSRPERRADASRVAAAVVADQPSATADLLPVFGALLESPERGDAAALLGGLAPASAAYADQLVSLATDSSEDVRDYTLWALLRLKDRRCAEPLRDRFDEREDALSTVGCGRMRGHWSSLKPPGAHEMLMDAPEFAADFLPWICGTLERSTHRFTVRPLARLLQAWGPVGAPAAPPLARQLDDDDPLTVEWCADTLADIGGDDELSMAALEKAAKRTGLPWAARTAAATAFARLGGSTFALELLRSGLSGGQVNALRWAASLGEIGAPLEGALRAYETKELRDEVAVAYALARVTGDAGEALPVFLRALAQVDPVRIQAHTIDAMRALARVGPLPAVVGPVLREILARDERFSSSGGCELFRDDEAFRRDAERALANCAS